MQQGGGGAESMGQGRWEGKRADVDGVDLLDILVAVDAHHHLGVHQPRNGVNAQAAQGPHLAIHVAHLVVISAEAATPLCVSNQRVQHVEKHIKVELLVEVVAHVGHKEALDQEQTPLHDLDVGDELAAAIHQQ